MSRNDLRRQRYFVAVAEELHFGRAARRLHVSQPPLSQQIRALEADLGVALFERDRHHVRLTAAGQVYLQHARALLRAAEVAEQAARQAAAGEGGSLRLGYSASAMHVEAVLSALGRFRQALPAVELRLVEGRTHEHAERIERNDIDLAVVRAPLPAFVAGWPDQRRPRLLDERLVAALPPGHALCSGPPPGLQALADEAFIAISRTLDTALNRLIDSLMASRGLQPETAMETWDMASLLGLVSVGAGVAIVPASLASTHAGQVVFRPLADEDAVSSLHLLQPARPLPAAERLAAMLLRTGR